MLLPDQNDQNILLFILRKWCTLTSRTAGAVDLARKARLNFSGHGGVFASPIAA